MISIIVVFGLDAAYAAEDEEKAYRLFAELGLSRVQQKILLPKMTVAGTWYEATPIATIRNGLASRLTDTGVRWTHLLVIESVSAAWYGPTVA